MARHRRRVNTSKRKSTGTHTRRTRKTAPVAVIPVGATPLPRRRIVGGNRRGGYRLPTGMEMQTGGFNIKKIPIIGPIIGGIASLFKWACDFLKARKYMPIRFYGDDDHTGDGIVKPSTYARPARTSNAHGHAPRWVSAAPKFSNNGTTTGGIYKKKRRVQRKKKGGKK